MVAEKQGSFLQSAGLTAGNVILLTAMAAGFLTQTARFEAHVESFEAYSVETDKRQDKEIEKLEANMAPVLVTIAELKLLLTTIERREEALMKRLERRVDNVVGRSGYAPP